MSEDDPLPPRQHVDAAPAELTGGVDQVRERIAEAAAELAGDPRADLVRGFVMAALRRVPPGELANADVAAAARQLVDAFRFADSRRPHELRLRVHTPEVALDGWSEPGTVVEVNAEDRPFLLTTVTEELRDRGLATVRSLHPILGVERDADGRLLQVLPARSADRRESFLHVELDADLDEEATAELERTLRANLTDVVAATDDYERMRERIEAEADRLRTEADGLDGDAALEWREAAALLDWLLDDNFVLLGVREYELVDDGGRRYAQAVRDSGAGILREVERSNLAERVPLEDLPDQQRERLLGDGVLTVSRTNRLSTVHRRARMEYVGLRRRDADGDVVGEFRVLGLFTQKGYAEPSRTTPVLRRKLERILELEDVVPDSHDEATLVALFQALPKDELFQSDVRSLHGTLVHLLRAEEQRETTVALRIDPFIRTVSVMVAVPRDRYSPQLREQITNLLTERFDASRVDVDLSLGDRAEALARFNVEVPSPDIPDVPAQELQRQIRQLTRSWVDAVTSALVAERGEAEGTRLARAYAERFGRGYQDATPVRRAVADVVAFDELLSSSRDLHVVLHDTPGGVRLQAFRQGDPLELSGFLPILESLGLIVAEEVPNRLRGDGPDLWLHDFGIRDARGVDIDVDMDGERIAEATLAAWQGLIEADSLNRLVLTAGLSWRQVNVLRAYRRYRRQVGTAYTTGYINDTLAQHPEVVRALIELFEARFEPQGGATAEELEQRRNAVRDACDAVERLDQDRILRGFLAMIEATLRTNAYVSGAEVQQADGTRVPYLSLKFDPSLVPDVPKPVPYREIFVYSPYVEGIHLRGGPVARGGIRWSDRQDDVRTEVLGLMKAQMLKNAVIVPTGAKGGFVVKRPPEDREQLPGEVQRQYVTFIRGLLDITDDIREGEIVHPDRVEPRDGEDAYLVVAADKGTATFSDMANRVAEEYGFWLGDAFASGGSRGYDHKALGITARGAWVAVRRHFRELGIDTQTEPIDVVGIGDMSGDVFGNGMLSSRTIRLVGAFDHRHIFLDPDPDPEASYQERQRLYDLPGSTWDDYDRSLISEGGGVHPRSAKRVPISPQVREALRIDDEELSPPALIQAILRAPVDLLFAGGIGTYVKASTQTHDEIGDRANDEVRVDANDLRARVYGEGANLSITQPARIQYARRGGRINQDAIDNAGGVDTSDREVNLKILLRDAIEGERIDLAERDRLLTEVTDDVVAAVLRDVDVQTWRLTQEVADSPRLIDAYEQLMLRLEEDAGLDRTVEVLPIPDEMAERVEQGAGLTRPELATLVGFAKRALADEIVRIDLPDQPSLQPVLAAYFPDLLVDRFTDLLSEHRLRRELIAMMVANDLINRLGITTAFRLADEHGVDLGRTVAAYWSAREVAGADARWRQIEDLDELLGPERQLELKRDLDRLVLELTRRYLDDPALPDVGAIVERDRKIFEELADELMSLGTATQQHHRLERAQRLVDDLVEEGLATYLASARDLAMAPDIAAVARLVADEGSRTPAAVMDAFLRLGDALSLDRLLRFLTRLEPDDRWARLEHGGLAADLRELRTTAVAAALQEEPSLPEPEAVDRFLRRRAQAVDHAVRMIGEVESADEPGLHAVAVAVRAIRSAVREP